MHNVIIRNEVVAAAAAAANHAAMINSWKPNKCESIHSVGLSIG